MGGQEPDQVEGLGRALEAAEPDDPVLVLADLLADERGQELAASDARDRRVDLLEFATERVDRALVQHRGATVHVELAVRVRQREQAVLDGAVRRVALDEDAPGHDRALEALGRRVRPAGAEQRAGRERPLEAHAIERALGEVELRRVEQQRAEDEVGLVPDGARLARVPLDAAGAVELAHGLLGLVGTEKRDAQVVRREAGERLGALDVAQHVDRLHGPPEGHQHVRPQEGRLVPDGGVHAALDPIEGPQRLVVLPLVEVDAREAERRLVAHGIGHVRLEHRLDRAAGAVVHAVLELEVADRELGLVDVMVERVEVRLVDPVMLRDLGVEALERLEVVTLMGVEERLPEVRVAQLRTGGRAGASERRDEPDRDGGGEDAHRRLSVSDLDAGGAELVRSELYADELRPHLLLDLEGLLAAPVAPALELARDGHVHPVRARREVARIDALHAALAQRLELVERVDVVRDELAVDLDANRVETRVLVGREGDEDGHLGVRRIEQLLFEQRELRRDREHVGLDLLHLLVEALHLRLGHGLGARTRREREQHDEDERAPCTSCARAPSPPTSRITLTRRVVVSGNTHGYFPHSYPFRSLHRRPEAKLE